ncbi:hypothetical protein LQZ21_14020 [Treponema sp. TIM-1]|uniref:hypothetical protein n=1 Tax=Treponema sp. TIM-1 TaxID=2898417 RepID=UPI0039817376
MARNNTTNEILSKSKQLKNVKDMTKEEILEELDKLQPHAKIIDGIKIFAFGISERSDYLLKYWTHVQGDKIRSYEFKNETEKEKFRNFIIKNGIYKPKNEYTNDRLGPFEIRWLGSNGFKASSDDIIASRNYKFALKVLEFDMLHFLEKTNKSFVINENYSDEDLLEILKILTIIREDENKYHRVLTVKLTDLYDNIVKEQIKRRNINKKVL